MCPKPTKPSDKPDRAPVPWDAGLLMAILGVACFATTIGFDTHIQSSFDLSKLAVLYIVVMLLIVGYVTKTLVAGEIRLARTPLDWPIAATLVVLALSTTFSVDWRCSLFGAYKTFEGAVQLSLFIMFYYAACRLRRPEVVGVMGIVLATAFGAGAYGLVQRLGHDPLRWSMTIPGRMISTLGNPVFFGTVVAMAVPLGLGLFMRASREDSAGAGGPISWVVGLAVGAAVYGLMGPLWLRSPVRTGMVAIFRDPLVIGVCAGLVAQLGAACLFRSRKGEDDDVAGPLCWAAGLVLVVVFCVRLYPELQIGRGDRSSSTAVRLLVLAIASVGLCAALGWRQFFRRRPDAWPSAMSWLALTLALACNAAFYCSRTLGVLLGLAAGLGFFALYMAYLWPESFRRHRGKWALLAASVVGLNLGFNRWAETSVSNRLANVLGRRPTATAGQPKPAAPAGPTFRPSGSFYKRMLLYHTALNIAKAHPVLGVGPDAIERAIAKHWDADYQLRRRDLVQVQGFENRIHNEWLEVWASQGTLGLVARLWLYGAFVVLLWKAKQRVAVSDRPVLAGLAAAWAVYVAQNVFEFPTIPISVTVWTLMGCTVAWVQNGGDPERWPTRGWRIYQRPDVVIAVGALTVTGLVLACFWVRCLYAPYEADRHFMRGISHQRHKRLSRAKNEFAEAVKLNPKLHLYRERLTMTLLTLADRIRTRPRKDWDLATLDKLAGQIIDNSTGQVRHAPWRASGYTFLAAGQDIRADVLAARTRAADAAMVKQLRRDSYTNMQEALEANPYNVTVRVRVMAHCLKLHRWDALTTVAAETVRFWPRKKQVRGAVFSTVQVLLQIKKPDEAERLLLAVKDLLHETDQGKVHDGLVRVYWAKREWAKMAEAAQAMLDAAPSPPHARRCLAVAYLKLGRLQEAKAECERALQDKPGDKDARLLLRTVLAMIEKARKPK